MIAIIPARGGSKGVPRKNIKELDGFPLMFYSIKVVKQIFGKVYVSTEDEEIAQVAKTYGAEVIIRPVKYAADDSTDYDWLKHAFSVIKDDTIAIFRPTTPLRCAIAIIDGMKLFEDNPGCSSMRSAHKSPESPYKWFEKDYNGKYWKKNVMADLPRQSLPKIFIPNGYLDITRRETVDAGNAFGDKILGFETEPVVEIDTQQEFDYLKYIIENQVR